MVDVNIFEKVVKEYFEFKGYFLKENVSYGNKGNEADLLGLKNDSKDFIHVEVTESNLMPKELKDTIKTKFSNDFVEDMYVQHFKSKKVKKIFVLWGYKTTKTWKRQKEIGKEHNIEILSFEDIFELLEEKAKSDSWKACSNKIYSLIKMFKQYEDERKK